MPTITIDIINEKALTFLRDMELSKLIRLRGDTSAEKSTVMDWKKYKGAMSKQPLDKIDQQLNQLGSE
ncbi:hypothetical protein [Cyclobacterium plantarum]|uniref:hypothetical protein n=1 Tax=Cyclobacterium plantarum TaxID=2716263 RepID=UPI003F71DCE6